MFAFHNPFFMSYTDDFVYRIGMCKSLGKLYELLCELKENRHLCDSAKLYALLYNKKQSLK